MIVFESRSLRRLVGRFAREERIPEAFRIMAVDRKVSTGWISALGAFEWVELMEYDQHNQRYRESIRLDAPCEILSLVGNVSLKDGEPFVHLHAAVSREKEGRIEVLGGHLVDGSVFACEFVVECYEDLRLRRKVDALTGLSLWTVAASESVDPVQTADSDDSRAATVHGPPVDPMPAFGPQPISWADVARASSETDPGRVTKSLGGRSSVPGRGSVSGSVGPQRGSRASRPASFVPGELPVRRKTTDAEFFGEPVPKRGDWVEHKQFGICRVEGHDAEGGMVIRLASGRRTTLSLDALEVLPPRQDGERRVFPVQKRTR